MTTDHKQVGAAELLRDQAEHMERKATDCDESASMQRLALARSEALAVEYRDTAAAHRRAADKLDLIADGGQVINVYVTATSEDVTQQVVDALQASANRAAQ